MIRLNIFGIGNKIQKKVWFSFLANLGVLKSILRKEIIKRKLQNFWGVVTNSSLVFWTQNTTRPALENKSATLAGLQISSVLFSISYCMFEL